MQRTTEVASCYINKNIKITEIYANWVRKKKLERLVDKYYIEGYAIILIKDW